MRVHEVAPDGPPIAHGQDAVDLLGETWGTGAELVAVPVGRLPAAFFRLSTGVAGEVLQKFANYRCRVAVVGDIEEHLAASSALRAFVQESNAGSQVWFVRDRAELDARVAAAG